MAEDQYAGIPTVSPELPPEPVPEETATSPAPSSPAQQPWEVEHIGPHTLYLGDCREVLPTLAPVDAVVCDPPYGVNLGTHAAAKETRGWLAMQGYASYQDTPENLQRVVVPAVQQALKQARRGVVFVAGTQMWAFPVPSAVGCVYISAGMGRNCWGFQTVSHYLLYGTAPALERGAQPMAFASHAVAEKNGHPCPKPLAWLLRLVALVSRPGEHILDPFMGSGTTGVACVQLGRVFTGIEIERAYFDIACQRMHDAMAQPDLFVPTPAPVQERLFVGAP